MGKKIADNFVGGYQYDKSEFSLLRWKDAKKEKPNSDREVLIAINETIEPFFARWTGGCWEYLDECSYDYWVEVKSDVILWADVENPLKRRAEWNKAFQNC